jgi:hypothetical protein
MRRFNFSAYLVLLDEVKASGESGPFETQPNNFTKAIFKAKRCGKSVTKMFCAAFGYDTRTGLLAILNRLVVEYQVNHISSLSIFQPGDIFMQDNGSSPYGTSY